MPHRERSIRCDLMGFYHHGVKDNKAAANVKLFSLVMEYHMQVYF